MTPAQAAYKQFGSDFPDEFLYQWEDAGATTRQRWERIAQAAIDANMAGCFDVSEYYETEDEDGTETI